MGSLQSLLTKSSDFITPERRKRFAKKKMSKFVIIFVVYLSFASTDGEDAALKCNPAARAANFRVKRNPETCTTGQKSCKFTYDTGNSVWKPAGCGPEKAAYPCLDDPDAAAAKCYIKADTAPPSAVPKNECDGAKSDKKKCKEPTTKKPTGKAAGGKLHPLTFIVGLVLTHMMAPFL